MFAKNKIILSWLEIDILKLTNYVRMTLSHNQNKPFNFIDVDFLCFLGNDIIINSEYLLS